MPQEGLEAGVLSGKLSEIYLSVNRNGALAWWQEEQVVNCPWLWRMEDSTTSNGPEEFSTEESDENEVYYKQRCKYLESQLEKFREQATKVREVISQKVCM